MAIQIKRLNKEAQFQNGSHKKDKVVLAKVQQKVEDVRKKFRILRVVQDENINL